MEIGFGTEKPLTGEGGQADDLQTHDPTVGKPQFRGLHWNSLPSFSGASQYFRHPARRVLARRGRRRGAIYDQETSFGLGTAGKLTLNDYGRFDELVTRPRRGPGDPTGGLVTVQYVTGKRRRRTNRS